MPKYVFAFASAAKEGRDAEYNEWYDTVHFKDVLAIPGIVSGRRLQVSPVSPNPPSARYLTEFDVEVDDPLTIFAELAKRGQSGEMNVSDSLDQSSVKIWVFERR